MHNLPSTKLFSHKTGGSACLQLAELQHLAGCPPHINQSAFLPLLVQLTPMCSLRCYTKINPQPMPPHCSGLGAFCCRAAVSALIFCKWWLCGLALPASLLLQFICWPHDGEEQTQSQCRLGAAQAASPVIYASYIAGCSFQPYQHDG